MVWIFDLYLKTEPHIFQILTSFFCLFVLLENRVWQQNQPSVLDFTTCKLSVNRKDLRAPTLVGSPRKIKPQCCNNLHFNIWRIIILENKKALFRKICFRSVMLEFLELPSIYFKLGNCKVHKRRNNKGKFWCAVI